MSKERKIVLKEDLICGFKKAGIKEGDSVIVHTSLKSLGFVCGGAQIVIEALINCIGKEGNILMPAQSWKNLDPIDGVHYDEPEEWWQIIRNNWPAYDKDITPTNTMGEVAEMFRKWPGTLRSDHPARSFAAYGKNASYLIKNHDLSDIFGETSPLAKLYKMNGKVILIGVGYDKNTSLHLADVRAEYDGKHNITETSAVLVDGKRERVSYETLYVDGEDFEKIGFDFEKNYLVNKVQIGNAIVRCMRMRQLVDYAVKWIEKNRK